MVEWLFPCTEISLGYKNSGDDMSHYTHLRIQERENIMTGLAQGKSYEKIARELGRNKGTISREIHRNSVNGIYSASIAQENYHIHRQHSRPKLKLSSLEFYSLVKDKFLNHQWSPEQISHRLKLEKSPVSISTSTIYRGIYTGLFDSPDKRPSQKGSKRFLRHKGKPRHTKGSIEKRGKIPISHELNERPIEAENRSRLGDWEADTVIGVKGKACLVTLVDMKSRYLLCCKAEKKGSDSVNAAIINLLENQPLHTITPDRGKEFANHKEITAVLNGVQFYFPPPHQPWKRGTNENTNGLLREQFPKGKDISGIEDEYIQAKVDELNKRPRKCLEYKTPFEIYYSKVLHLI